MQVRAMWFQSSMTHGALKVLREKKFSFSISLWTSRVFFFLLHHPILLGDIENTISFFVPITIQNFRLTILNMSASSLKSKHLDLRDDESKVDFTIYVYPMFRKLYTLSPTRHFLHPPLMCDYVMFVFVDRKISTGWGKSV